MKKKILIILILLLIITGCKKEEKKEAEKIEYTVKLKEQILNDNKVQNNYTFKEVEEGEEEQSGLFSTNNTNGNQTSYFFRGAANNYVSFAGLKWRIVRINEDGTIRIIMENGLNSNTGYNYNEDSEDARNMYYEGSNVMNIVNKWYDNYLKKYDDYLAEESYCTEFKAVDHQNEQVNGAGTPYASYEPSLRCSNPIKNKIGLLSMDEAMYAGSFYRIISENLYLANGNIFWTLSPAGNDNDYVTPTTYVWIVDKRGELNIYDIADGENYNVTIRPVINLNSDIIIKSGNGTFNSPYVVYTK